MNRLLEGRIAVVTGSGDGIGRAEAIGLAQQGAKVIVNDIGTATNGKGRSRKPADAVVREIKQAGNIAAANYDSVATEKGAERIIQAAVDNFGRIDILINNAGVFRAPKNIADVPTDDWNTMIKTHLFGTFYTTRCACSFMRKQGYGRIINTSSHTGLGWKGSAAYGAAKEGIVGFTRTVARDMSEFGVNCNVIRPLAAWRGAKENTQDKDRPEDVASLVVYLASEQADQINGCIFEVWHGHVGIFTEPPTVQDVLNKEGSWTSEELARLMPQTLTKGRFRELPPTVLKTNSPYIVQQIKRDLHSNKDMG
jgi:NAD(P)-dependent dehydrogenase (short-subunit alcohol dehydrogenase family)